ncbi:hypothetical protein E2C01_010872 [Portunus trituberculatus]|uniref:Uncharacterized protein n=1 Tax=Portunus trituberculatus TaxID=210409 RepID=A0A5B7D9L5_PORTR|nr:hypothetical protein [Portunus trituberculatus]
MKACQYLKVWVDMSFTAHAAYLKKMLARLNVMLEVLQNTTMRKDHVVGTEVDQGPCHVEGGQPNSPNYLSAAGHHLLRGQVDTMCRPRPLTPSVVTRGYYRSPYQPPSLLPNPGHKPNFCPPPAWDLPAAVFFTMQLLIAPVGVL